MKYSNRKVYFQWFGIGVFITFICLGFGLYITHYLTKKEERSREDLIKARQEGRLFGPMRHRLAIMRDLIKIKKLTPEEAFHYVDKANEAPFAEATYLLDENKHILDKHVSPSFNTGEATNFEEHEIAPNRSVKIYFDPEARRPHGPPHKGSHGPGRFKGPPKEFLYFGFLAIGVSIIAGIGISLVLLTMYLRKKSRNVEEVMSKIKSGELHTRFHITQTDEAGGLMGKFNEMAEEIENLVNNLRETEESRKKLLQELAHDLRTPVASLKSLQEILFEKSEFLEGEQKQHLQALATKEVNYFQHLVEDLLFLSGVNDPRYTQNMKCIDLNQLIKEELEVFDVGKINLRFKESPDIKISADEHLLRRLLKNALSNAVRFAKNEVTISLEKEEKEIILSVTDDGPGFKHEDFETFGKKKYSRELSQETSGHISVGLGSVIMSKIMTLHNGSLSIRNKTPGAQVLFTFHQEK